MSNLIKQIVKGEGDSQTIKIIVRDNERGAQGEQGEQGQAATIAAGNAYSVPATYQPSVINTGTSSEAVFDFYIPHGEVDWGDIDGTITDQKDLKEYLDKVDTALQPDDIDYTVMQDLSVGTNGSTSILQLDADKVNLKNGETTTKTIPLPVASSVQAGVMNSATFDAVANNSANIQTILSGMVAVSGLPSAPTQAELTTAWEAASGLTELSNYARMLDVDNDKYWTYYTNTNTWYAGSADIQVAVSTFTNSSEGTILGSTTTGQVYAESNGTGSVNGWDSLTAQVEDNTANKLATTNLTVASSLDKTTSGSGSSTVVQLGVADGGVSTAKLADGAVTRGKLAQYAANNVFTENNLSPSSDTVAAWKTLLGNTEGVYWTWYTQTSRFAKQPSQYGFLETVIKGAEIYQRWHSQSGGIESYRAGNGTGWYGQSGNAGVFRQIADNSQVATQTGSIISNNWFYSLVRYGNVVQFNLTAAVSTSENPVDNFVDGSWNKVPSGYRPIEVTGADTNAKGAICNFQQITAPGTTEDQGSWRIDNNGAFHLYTNGWAASQKRFSGSTTWITNDAWPS